LLNKIIGYHVITDHLSPLELKAQESVKIYFKTEENGKHFNATSNNKQQLAKFESYFRQREITFILHLA